MFEIAISPDGLVVASFEMLGYLNLWNERTCNSIARIVVHRGRPAFLPNHNLLVFFGEMADTLIIDPASGEVLQRLPPSFGGVVAPDGKWIGCVGKSDIAIWTMTA